MFLGFTLKRHFLGVGINGIFLWNGSENLICSERVLEWPKMREKLNSGNN